MTNDEGIGLALRAMTAFVDVAFLLIKVWYYCSKSLFLCFLPVRRKDISNDVILITGGGRGIGRQIALEFTKCKPKHIILWGRNKACLESTTREIQLLGVACTYMTCDVSSQQQIFTTAHTVQREVGDVSILVNNAGVVTGRKVVDSSDQEIQNTIAVNTMAHLWTLKTFLPAMLNKKKGHIVTISSTLGMMAMSGLADYCASKYATTGLCESLSLELQEYSDINITSVHPYMVDNDMFAGLKLRFPWLIPVLSEKYVAEQTVRAVLTNKPSLIIPHIMSLVILFQRLFPEKVLLPIYKFLGTDTAMDNFHAAKLKTS